METQEHLTGTQPLANLEAAAHRHAITCRDAVVDVAGMTYHGDGNMTWNAARFVDEAEDVVMEPLAYQQLVQRLHGPRPTWLKDTAVCPSDLEQTILQRLIKHRAATDRKHYLMRMRDGHDTTVRAVLSDQYTPFDNETFITMVGDALETLGDDVDVVVARASVGDYLRAYVLLTGIEFNLPDGEDGGGLHPGIYLSNSEVGTGSVRVAAGLWREICTNGAIFGWNANWNRQLVHRHYTEAAFRAVVADNVANGLGMSRIAAEKFVASYNETMDTTRLHRLINQWSDRGITVDSRERWKTLTKASASDYSRQEVRLFDVINGLTQAAQMTNNEDEQELMERTAGDILVNVAIPNQEGAIT